MDGQDAKQLVKFFTDFWPVDIEPGTVVVLFFTVQIFRKWFDLVIAKQSEYNFDN